VLAIVVRLEQGETEGELEQNAADGPDVAGLRPAELQDDLRGAVVPGGHDGAVVLVVEGGTPEVDEAYFRITNEPEVLLLLVVVDQVVRAVVEKDVLRLEVGVGQPVVVHEFDCVAKLVPDLTDLLDGVRNVVVVLEEVEDGGPQHLENDAHVAVKIEPVKHLDATVLGSRVVLGQLLQDVDLKLGGLSILLYVLDNFEREDLVLAVIFHLDDLAEGAFAERGQNFVAVLNEVANVIDKVTFVVVFDDGSANGLSVRRFRVSFRRLLPAPLLLPRAAPPAAVVEVLRLLSAFRFRSVSLSRTSCT